MRKHYLGAAVLALSAFVVRFGTSVPAASWDIYMRDTYIVVLPRVIAFWLLLASAAACLTVAVLGSQRR